MEVGVLDLLLTASRVCYITVCFLGPNIDVVHEDADSYSTSLILVQVEVAAVPARHEAIEVPGVGHARESFVLDCDYSPLSSLLRSVKKNAEALVIWSVAEHIVKLLRELWLVRQEEYREAMRQILIRLEHKLDINFNCAVGL